MSGTPTNLQSPYRIFISFASADRELAALAVALGAFAVFAAARARREAILRGLAAALSDSAAVSGGSDSIALAHLLREKLIGH